MRLVSIRKGPLGCFAFFLVVLSGCAEEMPIESGNTIRLTTGEGSVADLTVADRSGLLIDARNAVADASVDRLEIAAVQGEPSAISVTWVARPCEERPRITIDGDSLEAIVVEVDVGPIVGEVECPDMGALFSVALAFNGPIAADSVTGTLANE